MSQHTRVLSNLSRSLKTPDLRITFVTLSACSSFEGLAVVLTCTLRECVTCITKYMTSAGIKRNFGRVSGYSLKCALELVASNSHVKVS